ncbi:hypothetical protein ABIB82_004653 [Bradyrhizobium sp. i1.8.4]
MSDVHPHVVPAKAGTDNHRVGLLKRDVAPAMATITFGGYGSRVALRLPGTTRMELLEILALDLPDAAAIEQMRTKAAARQR